MQEERVRRVTVAGSIVAVVAVLALLVAGVVGADGSPDEAGGDADVDAVASGDPDEADAGSDEPSPSSTTATSASTTVVAPAEDHDADHDDAPTPVASGRSPAATTIVPSLGVPATHVDHPVTTIAPPTTPAGTITVPSTTTTAVPTGPIISVDDPRLTEEQRAAAVDLIDRTARAMSAFATEADVVAAGYSSIGDGATGFEHFVSWTYLLDDTVLDPARVESIVMRVANGTKTVVSAMFILPVGATMVDVPDIAGELTTWHDHQNLCWEGGKVVGLTRADGSCERGVFQATPPMLHVWVVDHPCGPFAGIEGSHGGGCGH